MKKTAILCLILIGVMTLTACTSAVSTAVDTKTTIEMELNENYDDTDPFINEKLFCVSEDLDTLAAKGTFEMDGRTGILELKNNKTDEVLWSNMWEGTVKSESFSISLENLKKAEEYVVCFTGTEITHATIEVAFESDFVQERETPARYFPVYRTKKNVSKQSNHRTPLGHPPQGGCPNATYQKKPVR